jgi:2,3-bisphosphoglycerate-independent phosphoglycerate mutase
VLVLPDHPTPVRKMTHTPDPVPFILFDSGRKFPPAVHPNGYNEREARASGIYIEKGHELMARLIKAGG